MPWGAKCHFHPVFKAWNDLKCNTATGAHSYSCPNDFVRTSARRSRHSMWKRGHNSKIENSQIAQNEDEFTVTKMMLLLDQIFRLVNWKRCNFAEIRECELLPYHLCTQSYLRPNKILLSTKGSVLVRSYLTELDAAVRLQLISFRFVSIL